MKKNKRTAKDEEASMGANRLPKGENTIEERKVMVGKVVPSVNKVLLSASNNILVFSAIKSASECSNPVLWISHANSR